MSLVYTTRPSRVRHMLKSVYEDNYGHTMNFYQPMLDYLDAKAEGLQVQVPHLPWTSERGLKQYRSSNAVRQYHSDDIIRLSRACAARADQILLDFRLKKRTPFSVKKLADASRVTRHIDTDSIIERSCERRRKRQEELEDTIKKDTVQLLQRIHKMELDNDYYQISNELKRQIRGKSASAIAQALLTESERNIKTAKKDEEDFISRSIVNADRAGGNRSSTSPEPRTTALTTILQFHGDRSIDKLDHRISSSLYNVKRQLSSLNQKTVEFYMDSRCGLEDKCWICRKVMRTHPNLKSYN